MKGFDGRDDEDDAWIFIASLALFQFSTFICFYMINPKSLFVQMCIIFDETLHAQSVLTKEISVRCVLLICWQK